jgi:hypothetical protein
MRTRLGLIALFLLAAGMLIVPLAAQDSVVEDGDLTIVTGAVTFGSDGSIIVAGITIAPASAFNPSTLREGDLVIITGVLLNELTLQAISLEFFEDDPVEVTPEPTPEATPESTPEATPEMTPEPTMEVTPEITPEPTYETCGNLDHPVAQSVAERFGVPVEEVIALHCAGTGYGNIIRAYTLAELADDGSTAADFLARHQGGEGWGDIMRESGVDRSELAPGQVLKQNREDADASGDDQGDKGQGQADNGEDKGKGGNGNGEDQGKGGNGNGEDKGKGQGGNGEDKGKGKGG